MVMNLYIQSFGDRYKKIVEENQERVNEMACDGKTDDEIHNEFLGEIYVASFTKKEKDMVKKRHLKKSE